jgi:hypothetical protein
MFLHDDAFSPTSDVALDPIAEATIIFCYSTALKTDDGVTLPREVSEPLAMRCRSDALIITTDKILCGPQFEVYKSIEVENDEVGGSTAHITRLTSNRR